MKAVIIICTTVFCLLFAVTGFLLFKHSEKAGTKSELEIEHDSKSIGIWFKLGAAFFLVFMVGALVFMIRYPV